MQAIRASVVWLACAFAAGLIVSASEKPSDAYQQTMKDLASANTALRNDVKAIESAGAYPDYNPIEKDAAAIKAAFEKTAAFWTEKKADDAVTLARMGAKHAEELEAARKGKDYDALMTAAAEIARTCGGCHTAHRDKMPDGTYEIK